MSSLLIGGSDLIWGKEKTSLMFELLALKTRSSIGKGWGSDGGRGFLVAGRTQSKTLWHSTFKDLRKSQYVQVKD